MTPEHWAAVEQLCAEALTKDTASRDAFLDVACKGDAQLRREVDSLLRHRSAAEQFLNTPIAIPGALAAESPMPDRIGGYRIIERLGTGGMGEVFLAEDDRLHRRIAIKRALPSAFADEHVNRRALTEARAAAQLDHPRICPIFEVGEDLGRPFIVMPVVEGDTLQARLRSGPLPIADTVEIAIQLADALETAHANGIVHRDIKPANLMLNARGEIRVMDFGLARFAGGEPGGSEAETLAALTATGITLGTAAYMSPEQARGERVDARTDLFSLGVVLYEMLTARRPFDGASAAEIITSTLHDEPASLVRQRPEIPDELQRIVSKALRKAPAERYQSATDVLVDLRALQQFLRSGESPTTAMLPSRRFFGRAGLGIAAAAMAAIAIGWWWIASHRSGFNEPVGSLLVLPLVNETGDAQKEYIADAITDSLIRDMAQLPALKVMGRQTAFQFKGKTLTPQQIGQTLPVRAVMSGRLRRAGDQLAIDVELSDTRDGSVIISRQYLEPAAQAARIEVNITGDLVRELRVKMTDPAQRQIARVSTTNGEAYQLHLRARFYQNRDTPMDVREALKLNQQAIALDPNYAVAWLDTSVEEFLLGTYFDSAREWMPQSKIAALQSLRLDPDAAGPHVMLGLVSLIYDWDMATAQRELVSSAGLDPSTMGIFSCAVHLLQNLKKPGQAERALQQAIAADPLAAPVLAEVGCNAYYERRYQAAIDGDNAALEIDPRNMIARWGLGRANGQLGKYDDALAAMGKVEQAPPIIIAERGYVLGRAGRSAEARKALDTLNSLKATVYVDPYFLAEVYAGLGDGPHTQEALEGAYRNRSGFMASLSDEAKWDFIRRTPAFADLQRRVGL